MALISIETRLNELLPAKGADVQMDKASSLIHATKSWQTLMNLKNAVDGVVGVNLFAKTMDYVRINSHLQIQFNMLNKNNFFIQLRFLG
jgi:hypothetical protein